MGRPHIARGPAVDNDLRAWAHHVYIKRMGPAPGIKFSRGPGQRVKAFLLLSNVDLKNGSFIRKIFNRSAAKAFPDRLF
jgi:hypothetical protein